MKDESTEADLPELAAGGSAEIGLKSTQSDTFAEDLLRHHAPDRIFSLFPGVDAMNRSLASACDARRYLCYTFAHERDHT